MERFAQNLIDDVELTIQMRRLRDRNIITRHSVSNDVIPNIRPKQNRPSSPSNISSSTCSRNGISTGKRQSKLYSSRCDTQGRDDCVNAGAGRTDFSGSISAQLSATSTAAESFSAGHFQETKLKREIENLQLDVSVFHEAKIMHTHFEDLVNEANSFAELVTEFRVKYELIVPEQNFSAESTKEAAHYWKSLRSEMKDRKSNLLNPLLRRIPTGTAKHLQNMHVLKSMADDVNDHENSSCQEACTTQILTMEKFMKEHKELRRKVDRLSSLMPKEKKNYNLNHLYIHGSAGVRSDMEYDASVVLNHVGISSEAADGKKLAPDGHSSDGLIKILKSILEKTVSNKKLIESQIMDLKLRGWNVDL